MSKTKQELLVLNNVIKNEVGLKANTAVRVGAMITDLIDKVIPILSNVTDFSTFTGTAADDLVLVTDTKRGGSFAKYSGPSPADNGCIFQDTDSQKWKRIITTKHINIAWYGAVLSTGLTDDIYSKFMAAIAASNNPEITTCGTVYIPGAESAKWYYCSARVNIIKKVKIIGDGSAHSHIRWNVNIGGIFVGFANGSGLDISGIRLSAFGRTGTSPGIEFKWAINCSDIWISTFGHGFYCDNTMPTGNSNNSTFFSCLASENNYHGYYFSGPDSNAMKLINCEAVANGGLGICDDSFLGNNYFGFHAATNGSPEIDWQKGLVKIGSVIYACIYDNTTNVEPGVTANWQNYWFLLEGSTWISFPAILTYDPATIYFAVGSWNLDGFNKVPLGSGQNQAGVLIGCYTETDQAPGYIGQGCLSYGGLNNMRGNPASLKSSITGFYTLGDFTAGEALSDTVTPKGFLSRNGVGIRVTDNEAALIAWDSVKKVGYFGSDSNNSIDKTILTTLLTPPASLGRPNTTLEGSIIGFYRYFLMTSGTNRNTFIKIDLATAFPPTTNLEYGDMFFATANLYNDFKPEAIVVKYLEPSAGGVKKNYLIKGFQEDILTGVTGTYVIGKDHNIPLNRGILYNVQFVGSDATDSCIINREVLIVNRAGVLSVVSNVAIRPDYVPGTFSTAAFSFALVAQNCQLEMTGLPAGTNGKVNIKRVDY